LSLLEIPLPCGEQGGENGCVLLTARRDKAVMDEINGRLATQVIVRQVKYLIRKGQRLLEGSIELSFPEHVAIVRHVVLMLNTAKTFQRHRDQGIAQKSRLE